jgi:hypothetical protein
VERLTEPRLRTKATGPYKADYYDHSGNHSLNVQVIVDSKGRVLSAYCGSPRSVHDALVFRNSGFYRQLLQGKVLAGANIPLWGVDVGQYLVGDAGYALTLYMMVPYAGGNLTP